MNLDQALLGRYSKARLDEIVQYIGSDKSRFDELIAIFLAGPYRVTQRSAWALSYCVEQVPALANGKLPVLLSAAERPGASDAVRRNVMRLLQFADIPKRNHARVANLSIRLLSDNAEPIAVRVFSMSVLARLCEIYPELQNELKLAVNRQLPHASPAFVSRARKVLKALKE